MAFFSQIRIQDFFLTVYMGRNEQLNRQEDVQYLKCDALLKW